ncbi:hypothetical protein KDA08_03790 [Candidatus Saccharibacteria bacterium]|nr:hypothetical protein [Candidatus Saccharibacteria bacterium]
MSSPNFKLNSSARRNRKPLIALVALVILIALGLVLFMYINNRNLEEARIEQKARDEAQTSSAKKDAGNAQSKNLPDNSTSITSDEVPVSEDIRTTITSTGQNEGAVYAEATITGTIAEGICVFTYTTPQDRPVVQQVSSMAGFCKSSIPEVQFSKLGAWNLQVIFYLSNMKSEANKNVSID